MLPAFTIEVTPVITELLAELVSIRAREHALGRIDKSALSCADGLTGGPAADRRLGHKYGGLESIAPDRREHASEGGEISLGGVSAVALALMPEDVRRLQ